MFQVLFTQMCAENSGNTVITVIINIIIFTLFCIGKTFYDVKLLTKVL